jgi:hypothetical protein
VPTTLPAFWSAFAATASAIAAIVMVFIQRRNLLEAARPEIVLSNWSRSVVQAGTVHGDTVRFATIENVGRGPAFHVYINASRIVDNLPQVFMGTVQLPILPHGRAEHVRGDILLHWQNAPGESGRKHLPIQVVILCWDSRGYRHTTRYNMLAVEVGGNVTVDENIAPCVTLGTRTTHARSVRSLKSARFLKNACRRVPIARRFVPPDDPIW